MLKPDPNQVPVVTEVGTCPVCNGTLREPAGESPWASSCAGYHRYTHTFPCSNCGAQYMFGTPTGLVRHNAEGIPCTHDYEEDRSARRNCYHVYICKHCGDRFDIDSGD